MEVELRRVLRSIQHLLVEYRDLHKGPTAILLQTTIGKEEDEVGRGVTVFDCSPALLRVFHTATGSSSPRPLPSDSHPGR